VPQFCHVSDLGKSVSVKLQGGRIEHRTLCRPMSLRCSDMRMLSAQKLSAENAVEGSTVASTAPGADLSKVFGINNDVKVRAHQLPLSV
jgi:hypothetical protein